MKYTYLASDAMANMLTRRAESFQESLEFKLGNLETVVLNDDAMSRNPGAYNIVLGSIEVTKDGLVVERPSRLPPIPKLVVTDGVPNCTLRELLLTKYADMGTPELAIVDAVSRMVCIVMVITVDDVDQQAVLLSTNDISNRPIPRVADWAFQWTMWQHYCVHRLIQDPKNYEQS